MRNRGRMRSHYSIYLSTGAETGARFGYQHPELDTTAGARRKKAHHTELIAIRLCLPPLRGQTLRRFLIRASSCLPLRVLYDFLLQRFRFGLCVVAFLYLLSSTIMTTDGMG